MHHCTTAACNPVTDADHSANVHAKWIDTHAHLWTVEYLDELERLGATDTKIARDLGATDSEQDMLARLQMMNNAGVRCQVLSATPQVPQWGDSTDCARLARMLNEVYARVIAKFPGRFAAYATVPLPHVEEAIIEARYAIEKLGFKGIAVNTLVQVKTSLADPKFRPFFAELNRLKVILYIHPTGCGANSSMISDFKLEWVVGAPVEDMLATLQLLKANIPHEFKDIRFHVAHLGGTLGFLMQRIEDNFTDWHAFQHSPWETLKGFWFDTANFHAPALQCTQQTFGHERLLLGSDFPYFRHEKYTRAVTYIEQSPLSKAAINDVLCNNAYKLYGDI